MKATETVEPLEGREAEEVELCISCLQPNPPGTHFCRHCHTPLTSYAATGPFESLFAEGDMWRKAASRGRWAASVRLMIIGVLLFLTLSFAFNVLHPV